MTNLHYLVYRTTNLINKHIYIGCHVTTDLNDKYLGSGTNLKKAIKEFGILNFKKEIICELNSIKEILIKEREIVNEEFISREDTYNIILGGGGFNVSGCVTVKDTQGNTFMTSVKNPKYISGELVSINKGTVNVRDKDGNLFQVKITDNRYLSGELISYNKGYVPVKNQLGKNTIVKIDDPRYISGEFKHIMTDRVPVSDKEGKKFSVYTNDPKYLAGEFEVFSKNKVVCEDKDGNKKQISLNDPRYLSGEFTPLINNKLIVKDKDGNNYRLDKNDPRILSGELVHVNKGLVMKDEHKKLRSEKLKGRFSGENSKNFGKCYIHDSNDNQKYIAKNELQLYLDQGWLEGRKTTYKGANGLKCITNGAINKKVSIEVLQSYLDQGWILGTNKKK